MSAGVLRIHELHDTIVVCLIETKDSARVLSVEGLHSDDFILAETLAGLIVCQPPHVEKPALDTLPLCATGVRAGGAFFTGIPKSPGFRTLTATTHTVASSTAHLSIV